MLQFMKNSSKVLWMYLLRSLEIFRLNVMTFTKKMPRIPLVLPANLNQMAEEVLFPTYVPANILDPYETKFCRLT